MRYIENKTLALSCLVPDGVCNTNIINDDTAYDANFITWLSQKNQDWRTQVSPSYCRSNDLVIDFGSQYGIWLWMNNNTWVSLHSLSPNSITTGYLDNNALADVIIDFGEAIGIWVRMNNDSWVKLHSISGEGMVTARLKKYQPPSFPTGGNRTSFLP